MIPALTAEEIARCEMHSISKFTGRQLKWRTVAQMLGLSPQRVLQHFDKDELERYQNLLRIARSKSRVKIRKHLAGDLTQMIKAYRAGMSARWCSDSLPAGIGRVAVGRVFATLAEAHGAARDAALNKKKVSAKERRERHGLKPSKYRERQHAAFRPPDHVMAERERALDYEPTIGQVLFGDPPPTRSAGGRKNGEAAES